MTITVADLLRRKKIDHPICIDQSATVLEALKLLAKENIGCLVVAGPNYSLQGMFSERDNARKIELVDRHADSTIVSEVMTLASETFKVGLGDSLEHCLETMRDKNIRHLPVVTNTGEAETVIALISIRDVVVTLYEEHKATAEELQHYVTANR